ncbi:hypothetical protein DN062_07465 [Nitrincola tibetensis]|uniref:Uncharacterized protein n=1 Tax=Nitrincola tibetensis TaxID=2219697 RepID=A0A364NNK3_9GAMM|nr:hypothetical protein [Nitrincola tibetensis]RAU18600.1 hypothetical protein DN062_07465 [Nitrincola tibetensis]
MNEQKTTPQAPVRGPRLYLHDMPLDTACVPCESANQCCEFNGKIQDAKDSSRYIQWPFAETDVNPNPSLRLLVIADQVEGSEASDIGTLFANVKVSYQKFLCGQDCKQPDPQRVSLSVQNQEGTETKTDYSFESKVVMPGKAYFAFVNWIPKDVLTALMILDTIVTFHRQLSGSDTTRITPRMCVNHPPSTKTFEVIPLPQIKLEGSAEVSLLFSLSTTAPLKIEYGAKSALTYIYGNLKQEYKGEAKESVYSSADSSGGHSSNEQKAPGVFGLLKQLVDQVSDTQRKGTPSNTAGSNVTHGNRVTLSTSVRLGFIGIELQAKSRTPDLLLNFGEVNATLKAGVTGTIDVLDTAAQMFMPAAASTIRKTRTAIANGERVNGDLQANIILAADSNVNLKIHPNASFTLHANGDDTSVKGLWQKSTLSGQLKVMGKAELRFHVEGKVWGVSAKVGANGSLHTAWCTEVRQNPDDAGEWESRSYFEGLVAEVNVYAEVFYEDTAAKAADGGRSDQRTTQVDTVKTTQTIFDAVDANIAESDRTAARLEAEDLERRASESSQPPRLSVEEAKYVLRTYDLPKPIAQREELERLENSVRLHPYEVDNQVALDNLLREITKDYHDLKNPNSLGVHQILAPTVNPINANSPKWTRFQFFGGGSE